MERVSLNTSSNKQNISSNTTSFIDNCVNEENNSLSSSINKNEKDIGILKNFKLVLQIWLFMNQYCRKKT
jgi:hypothetical protein